MGILGNARKNQENSDRIIENRLNLGNFITIIDKNLGKLSTAPLPPPPSLKASAAYAYA